MTGTSRWTVVFSTAILMVFILVATAQAKQETENSGSQDNKTVATAKTDEEDSAQTATHTVVVYYLYMEPRCMSCRNIEKFTKEAIEAEFEEELEDGHLVWMPVDVKKEGNWHYVEDFKIGSKSIVVADYEGEEENKEKLLAWKNLEEVWPLLKDKPGFLKYIQKETHIFLDQKHERGEDEDTGKKKDKAEKKSKSANKKK